MRARRKELGHEDTKVAALASGEKTSVTKSDNLTDRSTAPYPRGGAVPCQRSSIVLTWALRGRHPGFKRNARGHHL
jgi:hypothetical protein